MEGFGQPVLLLMKQGVHRMLLYTDRHDELAECMQELVNCYKPSSLYQGDGDVDFDDPAYQACYVFLYFPALCYGIFDSLQQFYVDMHFNMLLERVSLCRCLNVCALGGGPGTDLFGVRMFLNSRGYEDIQITATVLDRHSSWDIAFECLLASLDQQPQLSAGYLHFEASSRRVASEHLKAIAKADLITCSKFVSAIKALPNSRHTLKEILSHAKPGAYIFYLENSKGGNTEFFSSVARQANFVEVATIDRGEENPYQLPRAEQSWQIKELFQLFNFSSQRNLRVKCMLWRKTGQPAVSPCSDGRSYTRFGHDSARQTVPDHHAITIPSANYQAQRKARLEALRQQQLQAHRHSATTCPCILL